MIPKSNINMLMLEHRCASSKPVQFSDVTDWEGSCREKSFYQTDTDFEIKAAYTISGLVLYFQAENDTSQM